MCWGWGNPHLYFRYFYDEFLPRYPFFEIEKYQIFLILRRRYFEGINMSKSNLVKSDYLEKKKVTQVFCFYCIKKSGVKIKSFKYYCWWKTETETSIGLFSFNQRVASKSSNTHQISSWFKYKRNFSIFSFILDRKNKLMIPKFSYKTGYIVFISGLGCNLSPCFCEIKTRRWNGHT